MNDSSGHEDPAADLRSDLAGAFGLPVWGSRIFWDSSLRLSLGQPDPFFPRNGQWDLFVYFAAWRIETPDTVLLASAHDREEMVGQVRVLDGKVLVGTDVERPSLATTFWFEGGTRLRTFPYTRSWAQWYLYRPDQTVRVVGPNYSWSLDPVLPEDSVVDKGRGDG